MGWFNDWWHPDAYSGLNRRQVIWLRFTREPAYRWRFLAGLMIFLAVAALAGFYARHWLRHYRDHQYTAQAEQFLAQGNFKQAFFRGQMALRLNPNDLPATRVLAEVCARTGDPGALHWCERELELDPNFTNQLRLAATALRLEPYPFPTAAKTLNEVSPAGQKSPDYQQLAGLLALQLSQKQTAEQHFAEAVQADPANDGDRVSLAVLQLQSTNELVRASARKTLVELLQHPDVELVALRPLTADSFDHKDFARAEQFSARVVTNNLSTLQDWLFHLTILHAGHSPGLPAFLARAQHRAGTNDYPINAIATWMNSAGYAQAALDWLTNLPPSVAQQGLLPITQSDSYAVLGEWEDQYHFLRAGHWPAVEPIRLALLARVDGKLNDGNELLDWQGALNAAAVSSDMLNKLASLTAAWGWPARTEDILWLAAEKFPEQSWPLPALNQICNAKRDTMRLLRLEKILYQRNPRDNQTINNYAACLLLLDQDLPQAHELATAVYAASPTNAAYASTYALSLLRQGSAAQAVEILQKLSPEQLRVPEIAAYYGIALVAASQPEAAKPWLDLSASARLLPEEQSLVTQAKNDNLHIVY